MTRAKAEAVLVAVMLAVSSAYLFTKLGTDSFGPLNVVALRFGIAFVALLPFTWGRVAHASRATVRMGALLAVLMCAILVLQVYGLGTVTTGQGSFLASTTTGFVPLMAAVLERRLPRPRVLTGCALVLAGIFVLTGAGGLGLTSGAVMFVASAAVYGVFVIVVDRAGEGVDLLAAGVLEMGIGCALALALSCAFEVPRLPVTGGEWGCMLALGVVCSAFGLGMQPWAQQFTTPERYGVLFGLGPVFSAILGVLVLGETFTPAQGAGALIVLAGVLVVVLGDRPQRAGFKA